VDADTATVVVHHAGEGPGTWAMGSLFEHLVGADQTGGTLGMSMVLQPPGIATPLHRHTREAEALFVVEGRVGYRAGEETYELGDGSFLYLPLGVPHAFRVRGTRPARLLTMTLPGGLMGLYDEVGVPAREMRLPGEDGLPMEEEIARWNRVGPRYGLEVVGPPIPA
jgi:quercetin dioxygenase-like cupin family protein